MTIDRPHFTPRTAPAGGLLIALAAVPFMEINGRMAGVGGMPGGLLRALAGNRS